MTPSALQGYSGSSSLKIQGRSFPAEVTVSEHGGRRFISVRVESDLMLSGPGSPGQEARLRDDLGNEYPLYHGSASNPPRYSRWDFEGPLASGAAELTFEIDGYGVVEQGDWVLEVPGG
jgi:hypothetical protein